MAANSTVAHAWANQTGKHKYGSNFYYEDEVIYSYGHHYAVGRLIKVGDKHVALINNRPYSSSTNRHIRIAEDAVSHLEKFHVCKVEPPHWREIDQKFHEVNLQDYRDRIDSHLDKASRARRRAKYLIEEADALANKAQRYAFIFTGRKGNAKVKRASKKLRERAAYQTERCAALDRAANIRWQEAREQAKKALDARLVVDIPRWQRGEIRSLPLGGSVFLRAVTRSDGSRIVETSRGADVPYASARMLYNYARRKKEAGRVGSSSYSINGEPVTVGDFKLTAINEEDIVVGLSLIPI